MPRSRDESDEHRGGSQALQIGELRGQYKGLRESMADLKDENVRIWQALDQHNTMLTKSMTMIEGISDKIDTLGEDMQRSNKRISTMQTAVDRHTSSEQAISDGELDPTVWQFAGKHALDGFGALIKLGVVGAFVLAIVYFTTGLMPPLADIETPNPLPAAASP